MAQSLKADFNPEMVGRYRRGIDSRNVADVKKALESGVDPNTVLYKGAINVLSPLVHDTYQESAASATLDPETFERNTTEIVDLLLKHGLQLTHPTKHETAHFRYLIDRFMLSDSLADASNLILHAVYETLKRGEEAYQPQIVAQMRYLCENNGVGAEEAAEARFVINQGLLMMESLHESVRRRLLDPRTDMEKKLLLEYGDKLGYWQKSFPAPSIGGVLHALFNPQAASNDTKTKAPITQGGPLENIIKPGAPGQQKQSTAEERFAQQAEQLIQVMPKREAVEVLAEIEQEFIGLEKVKQSARDLVIRKMYDTACELDNIEPTRDSHSAIFTGNPGLGKTTFARKKAELLHAMGIVGPNYVEISPTNAVGGYIGHTEGKIQAILEAADVLFIDETYGLNDGRADSGDFGRKVINALVPALENNPDLVIFMAGYPEDMERLLDMNSGLRSRLTKHEHFEDMTRDELAQTFDQMLAKEKMTITKEARSHVLDQLEVSRAKLGDRNFGNARLVRNIVRALPNTLARRFFGAAAKNLGGLLTIPAAKALRNVTIADAKALDYGTILGTSAKDRKRAIAADVPASHADWMPSIGFGSNVVLRGERKQIGL